MRCGRNVLHHVPHEFGLRLVEVYGHDQSDLRHAGYLREQLPSELLDSLVHEQWLRRVNDRHRLDQSLHLRLAT